MCGINGIVSKITKKEELIHKMNDRILHRGPNAEGVYVDEKLALGQRRLSIIDLVGGNQPIYNKDKSSYIIENITYCKNYDISKYREINATLFEKNENTINEITSYEYKEESSILLDKFLGGKTFKGDYSKSICEKYKKDNLYLEVKVVTFDNKIDLINIPLVMEEKCK